MKSTASKREEHLKITNGGINSSTITTSDMNNLVPKSKTYSDIIKGKMISKEEEYTKITNGDTASYELTRKRQRQKAKHKKSNLFEKLTIGSMEILIDYSYNNGVQIMRTHVARSRKKLLILDVNGLLADIILPPPKDCKSDKIILKRAIFKRPFLDDFLRFCFQRFDVAIWSSRTRKVLAPVVDYLLGDLKKKLLFIWDSSHCTNSSARCLENWYKFIVFKDLKKIWEKSEFYDESNTLLLDDSPYKALLNPKHTGVFPSSYNYYNTNDNSLGPNGDLRVYLEGVGTTENIQMYVRQNPFGQSAIDEKSPYWAFYSKVLKDVCNKNN
ncbi:hypothetical protein LXL04_024180 [Taraxacum kok-saghyz]